MAFETKTVIALIGPSGSGKSRLGFSIAEKLGWQFIDSDREIEKVHRRGVFEIFKSEGESVFRAYERSLLLDIRQKQLKKLVIATGGGLPAFQDNIDILESIAVLVYLSAAVEVLVTRINQGEKRPLLSESGNVGSNSLEQIERLGKQIAERESIYSRAQYKIDTAQASPEELADQIIRLTGVSALATEGKDLSEKRLGMEG